MNLSSPFQTKGATMTRVKVPWPPALSEFRGQKYAICGSVWLPVPPETTWDDLSKYMDWSVKPKASEGSEGSWEIKGSKGNTYNVRRSTSGVWSCNCAGYGWRRKCRHIEEAKKN